MTFTQRVLRKYNPAPRNSVHFLHRDGWDMEIMCYIIIPHLRAQGYLSEVGFEFTLEEDAANLNITREL